SSPAQHPASCIGSDASVLFESGFLKVFEIGVFIRFASKSCPPPSDHSYSFVIIQNFLVSELAGQQVMDDGRSLEEAKKARPRLKGRVGVCVRVSYRVLSLCLAR